MSKGTPVLLSQGSPPSVATIAARGNWQISEQGLALVKRERTEAPAANG